MSTIRAREPGWADVLEDHAAHWATARRLVGELGACEAAALAFCRLLNRWARGEAVPSPPGGREAARRSGPRPEGASPRCGPQRTAQRQRCRCSTTHSTATCWSSKPTARREIP